jgi:hypothetical protein
MRTLPFEAEYKARIEERNALQMVLNTLNLNIRIREAKGEDCAALYNEKHLMDCKLDAAAEAAYEAFDKMIEADQRGVVA